MSVEMTPSTEIERDVQNEITRLFLVEIINNLGVVAAGKIFNRVSKQVAAEGDAGVRGKLQAQVDCLKALYKEHD